MYQGGKSKQGGKSNQGGKTEVSKMSPIGGTRTDAYFLVLAHLDVWELFLKPFPSMCCLIFLTKLFICNHASYMDGFLLTALLNASRWAKTRK